MGFDIECVIDIHTYPGEYFCPVCRTLVYPNEALQSQCTHLYCKPCLAHVANNTRACPYDGYLVTEADSKALLDADKVLAENVGKVKVRCLYHRSGCTWEGTLSESSSHCSGCAFGNSPVICNRCGVQIVHRQVHDHAQNCPGVYQAQQAAGQEAATSGTATAATTSGDQNQAVTQSAASTSQAQNPQNTAVTANAQGPAVAPASTPTPEQWYQQYYQQYAGYDPYHQTFQQYYPYQQQAAQQYQQMQGQYHPQLYSQPQLQGQLQTQVQPQAQPQVQPQAQPQVQQPQPNHQSQSQPQYQHQPTVQTQSQPQGQVQVPVLGLPQPQSHVQTMASQYHNHPQQQFPPPLQPQVQANTTPQPQPYTQPLLHPMQSQSQQYVQMSQYQQPYLQMHPPDVSQSNVQLNRPSQPQPAPQPQSQPQTQVPPQPNLQNYPQSHPPQTNQPAIPNAQSQCLGSAAPAVTGHQSYLPPQQMPTGLSQQHPVQPHSIIGSVPMHGQIAQQPPLMRPLLSHGPSSNQQQASGPHGQVPSIPPTHHQQFYPHAPPPGPPVQHRSGIQPIQQSLPQQPQTFSGPVPGQFGHFGHQQPMQSQLRPPGAPHVMQPGSHGYIPSNPNVAPAPMLQAQQSQNYVGRPLVPTHGLHPQLFPQSSGGFSAATHNKSLQPASNPPFGNQNYANRTSSTLEMSEKSVQGQGGLPILNSGEKDIRDEIADGIIVNAAKSETGMNDEHKIQEETRDTSETLAKDAYKEAPKGEPCEPVMKQMVNEEPTESSLGLPSIENPGAPGVEDKDTTGFSSKQKDMSVGLDKGSQAATTSTSETDGSDRKDSRGGVMGKDQSQHYGDDSSQHFGYSGYQQKFADPLMSHAKPPSGPQTHFQGPGYAPPALRPQGPEHMLPGHPMNVVEHSQPPPLKQPPDAPFGPGSTASFGGRPGFGPPPRIFELQQSAAQRPSLPTGPPNSVDPRNGIVGRVPQHGTEGQFGMQDSVIPVGNDNLQNHSINIFDGSQLNNHSSGSLERGPFGQLSGPPGLDAPSFGSRDQRFIPRTAEYVNPFAVDPIRSFDQASGRFDNAPPRTNYDGSKSDLGASGPLSRFMPPPYHSGRINPDTAAAAERELPVGGHEGYRGKADPTRARLEFVKPEQGFGRHHRDHPTFRSPGREYFGTPLHGPHSFGEGPGSFNLPLDSGGHPFPEDKFQAFSSHLQRIEPDGPENIRFGEAVATGYHNSHFRSGNPFDQGILPGHLKRGEVLGSRNFPGHHYRSGEPAGFGSFPGRGRMEEFGGGFPRYFSGGESFRGNHSSRLSGAGFRGGFSSGLYAGDIDPFDKLRKKKPVSMGWCRICKVDCQTVDGLDMHSQTREHQRMAMDIVKKIKQQNKKKSKSSGGHALVEEESKSRSTGFEDRGNKP